MAGKGGMIGMSSAPLTNQAQINQSLAQLSQAQLSQAQAQLSQAQAGRANAQSTISTNILAPALIIDEVANGYILRAGAKSYVAATVEELQEVVALALVNLKMDAAK